MFLFPMPEAIGFAIILGSVVPSFARLPWKLTTILIGPTLRTATIVETVVEVLFARRERETLFCFGGCFGETMEFPGITLMARTVGICSVRFA